MDSDDRQITPYYTENLDLNGMDVYFRDSGEGEPLVFLHGGASNHLIWWQQAYGLAPEYRCILPDRPGYGLSRAHSDGEPHALTPSELVGLLDHLGIEAATFIGHSVGGWPAAKVAEQCPERTRALIVVSSPAGMIDEWWSYVPDSPQMSYGYADSLDPKMKFLYDYLNRIGFDRGGIQFDVPVDPSILNDAEIPVALIHGNQDDYYPVSMMREMERKLSESSLHVVDGAGHSSFFEKPTEFNRIISEFLSDL